MVEINLHLYELEVVLTEIGFMNEETNNFE